MQLIQFIRWPAKLRIVQPQLRAAVEPCLVTGYLIALLVALYRSAAVRLFWFDELFTLHLARSPFDLWSNLAAGVDNNPPLGYWLTKLAVMLGGEAEWVVRLPAMLGALLGCLSLYLFVRSRRGPFEAVLAMTIITVSAPVWVYFLEARPYGLMVAFTGLALVAWQRNWPICFAVSLVLGIASHYYFVVPVVAFGCAEFVRIVQTRQLNRGMVAGFVAVTLALGALYPLWGYGPKLYQAGFWAKVKFHRPAVEDAFHELYRKETTLPIALALIVAAVGRRPHDDREPYPIAEAVAIAALAAGPLIGVAVGAKLTGAFYYRYIIPSMLGLAALFAFAIGRAAGGQRAVLLIAAGGFLLFGLVGSSRAARGHYKAEARQLHETAEFLRQHAHGTVLIESPFEFARIWHYHPELASGFIVDVELALKHTKSDTLDRGLLSLATITPVPLRTPDAVAEQLAQGKSVQFFGPKVGWQAQELAARGIVFTPIGSRSNGTLYQLEVHR